MSWRTQGHYKGLSDEERAWLEDFDRKWDTLNEGRSQTDAMLQLEAWGRIQEDQQPLTHYIGSTYADQTTLEALLIRATGDLARLTVPRHTKSGEWSIHLFMKDGRKLRVRFDDLDAATQAYYALVELSFWFTDA